MTQVCVDAGLVIKLVTPEEDSHLAELLFCQWKQDGTNMIAPVFAPAEVDSVLRKKVVRGLILQKVANEAFRLACELPIEIDNTTTCRKRAWEIAERFQFATVYDAIYLALAEAKGCEFWTADQTLYDQIKKHVPYVRFLRA